MDVGEVQNRQQEQDLGQLLKVRRENWRRSRKRERTLFSLQNMM